MNLTDFAEVELRRGWFRTNTLTQRANSTAYSLGDQVYAATADGRIYECITAGTSAGSPPTFNTTLGATTTDGGVTWMALEWGIPKRPIWLGLIRATRGYSDSIRSTAVSTGDTVIPATPNGRLYRCTTGGTTGASEPTWGTTAGGTTADGGTVVWTEMTPDLEAFNGNVTEVSGGSYARVQRDPSDSNWTAPDGAGRHGRLVAECRGGHLPVTNRELGRAVRHVQVRSFDGREQAGLAGAGHAEDG